jgi:hypothetical protein
MSEYRPLLEKAGDRAKPAPDAFEKLERRRARKQRSKRLATAVFAFAIAIAGSVGAFTAFRDSSGNRTTQLGGSSTDHFYALWPEQTLADAQRVQDQVDSGDPSIQWRTDAEGVAGRFATVAMGWHIESATWPDPSGLDGAGPLEVVVSTPPPPCPSPPPGTTMSCGPQVATLTLERLVRQDSTGIWSVTEVRSEFPSSDNALTLPFSAGETVTSGHGVVIPYSVPEGLEVQAGYTYLGDCGASTTFNGVLQENDQISFIVADASFEESCDTSGTSSLGGSVSRLNVALDGYVFVELVREGAEPADPFVGDTAASPIALAAVPVHFVPVSELTPTPVAVPSADVAQVMCDGTSTQVLTPDVAAQPDGVHISVTNTSSSDLALQFQEVGGDDAPVGTNEVVWPLPPGPIELRCMDPNADAGAPGGYVQLAIVDPHDFYVQADLQCTNGQAVGGNVDYVPGAKGEQGDPVDITKRNATGLLPTDTVEAAGYPDAATRIVRLVRDGNVVARFSYFNGGNGGWLMESYQACTDAGIGGEASSVGQNPYPRGGFTWCPALEGTLPPGPTGDAEASKAALDFARAFLVGDSATVAAFQDPSVPKDASWMIVGTPDGVAVLGTTSDQGHLVEYGCGPDAASRTVAVVLDDGTSSASADFTLYLVQRADGWKVWGSY